MNVRTLGVAWCLGFLVAPALADDTVKIAYVDPLSGGGASIGEVGLKTFQYLADELNAAGGLNGKKVEIVGFDNKVNPQETSHSGAEGRRRRDPLHHPGQRLVSRRGVDRLGVEVQ